MTGPDGKTQRTAVPDAAWRGPARSGAEAPGTSATSSTSAARGTFPTRAGAPLPSVDGSLVVRALGLSVRTSRRHIVVGLCLLVALLAAGTASLNVGTLHFSAGEILAALTGHGDRRGELVILGIRLPRLLAAYAVGACLALSGSVFQNLTGNPLGSPDFIGFVTGAATGAIAAILGFSAGVIVVALSALGGGLLTALAVVGLSSLGGRRRSAAGGGYRLVLVGIGVGAFLGALNDLMLTRVSGEESVAAQAWLVGSLNARNWDVVLPCILVCVVGLPVVMMLGRRMNALQLGDTVAAQVGVPVLATRLTLTAVGVLLVAAATATAGPISFVALAAPQIAWRLVGRGKPPAVCTALLGATLLAVADLLSQLLPDGAHLPVGLVTGLLGGIYLLVLLSKGNR